ncbi:hypothetical protein FS837_003966 [Tulasnella sp. UAMH 9824]|nr:hypothetical protein FS837_003966 [Tulasnella sp. UAMH 9824]
MDAIAENLWLSGLHAALHKETLQQNNIGYVLTVMRGDITLPIPYLTHYQIELDDSELDDLLVHLPPAIAFIDAARKSGKGVLVHCFAGMSRSVSVVIAYLMYSQKLDLSTALKFVQEKRPIAWPNDSFMKQLQLFHDAAFQPSSDDQATRRFYLERAVHSILKGEKAQRAMPAPYPTLGPQSTMQRRIRCRMCRQELASAEHVMHRRSASGSHPAPDPDSSISYTNTLSSPLAIAKLSEDVMRGLKRSTSTHVPPGALGVEVKQAALDAQLALHNSPDPTDSSNSSTESSIFPMRRARTVVPPASRPPVSRPVPRSKDPTDAARATATESPISPPIQDSGNSVPPGTIAPPPPIIDSACSGYFVEPIQWMEESSFAYG